MTHLLQAFTLIFLIEELTTRTQTQLILPTISAVKGLYFVTFFRLIFLKRAPLTLIYKNSILKTYWKRAGAVEVVLSQVSLSIIKTVF